MTNIDDLISRQEAIDELESYGEFIAINIIKELPTAQPEMVKCKKCRYVHYDEEFDNYWCNRMSGSFKVEADGYCKWGE